MRHASTAFSALDFFAVLLAALLLFQSSSFAETIWLKNAIVHTVSNGTFTNADVLIVDDKIDAVMTGPYDMLHSNSAQSLISTGSIFIRG